MRSRRSPGAGTVNVTVSGVVAKDAGQGLGTGTARRARARSAAPAASGDAGPTASVSETGASSGMQIFSHTSQLACPRSVTDVPGASAAGAVIGTGSTTSSV